MNTELIHALQNVGIEAIKILGPAIIAAYVAYKTGKSQMEAKLKEVDKRNEFEARKAIYDLLIQRKENISEGYRGILENIAFFMSAASGKEIDAEFDETIIGLTNTYLRTAQRMTQLTKETFEKKELNSKEEYSIILNCIEKVKDIQPANDYKTLRKNSLELIPIYEDLTYVHDSLVDWKMEEILTPYLRENVI